MREIVSGPNAGECRRPPGRKGVCDEDEDSIDEREPDYDQEPDDPYDTEYA
jgi:hypothetical protein